MRWNISNMLFLYAALVLGVAFTVRPLRLYAADELEQHLQDKYDDKTLVVRNFYRGERLGYDFAGTSTGSAIPGDWTVNGFVRVTSLSLSGHRLTIQLFRQIVSLW
jgi:hypothetical protein